MSTTQAEAVPDTETIRAFCAAVSKHYNDHLSYSTPGITPDAGKEKTHVVVGSLRMYGMTPKECRSHLAIAIVQRWVEAGSPSEKDALHDFIDDYKIVDAIEDATVRAVRAVELAEKRFKVAEGKVLAELPGASESDLARLKTYRDRCAEQLSIAHAARRVESPAPWQL